jgi:hypothetical protein
MEPKAIRQMTRPAPFISEYSTDCMTSAEPFDNLLSPPSLIGAN